jgi:hypothetical protein
MRKSSDGFVIVLMAVGFALVFVCQTIYERLLTDWILRQLDPWVGSLPAEVLQRFSALVVPVLAVLFLMLGTYRYTRRELARGLETARVASKNGRGDRIRGARDVWLHDAICRIFLGRWDKIPLNRGRLDLDNSSYPVLHDLITQHIRQLACDGRLPIWGKKGGYLALWELTSSEFWRHHQVDYESFLEADPRMLHALPCNGSAPAAPLRELMTSRTAVDAFCESVAL